jgi:endonuclease/exonuclease/phosphatase family metal-dependent hydrolase
VNHLISQTDPENDDRRAAQARRVRAIVEEITGDDPRALVAAVGDMNDTPDSVAVGHLLDEGVLVDAAAEMPADESWTYLQGRREERIDYVLLTPELAGMQAVVDVRHGALVDAASDHQPVMVDLHVTP